MDETQFYKRTYARILISAKNLFLDKGFQGASIADIANNAEVNKSLIYYHFTNKETLWKAVKEDILKRASIDMKRSLKADSDSLSEFLTHFLTFRFTLYLDQPELIRLMRWQALEETKKKLPSLSDKSLTDFRKMIIALQHEGEIRQDLSPKNINALMMAISTALFINPTTEDLVRKDPETYQELVFTALRNALSPQA